MSTGFKLYKFVVVFLLCIATLFPGSMIAAASSQHQKKPKKAQQQVDPLPSGPTGKPVQPMPLDSIAPVPPQVSYQNSQLTIVAPNSTLADILRAVRKQTGAEIDVPAAPERVVTHLGPGPAREVVAELLNGSRFNYVLLGSAGDQSVLTRVVLVAKTTAETASANTPTEQPQATSNPPGMIPPQPGNLAAAQPQEMPADANDAETTEDAPDDANVEQPSADGEQQPANSEQPGVKTPQQLLQEMQQRQLQLQQQQPGGQPPVPGVPPRPPQQ